MVYKWKMSYDINVFDADPEKIYFELEDLGSFVSEDVLEKGKDKKSELHKCFEWDDAIAGEKFRLKQASQIMRALVIIPEKSENFTIKHEIRGFENVENEDGDMVYMSTKTIVTDESLLESLIEQIIASLSRYEKKLKAYESISENALLLRKNLSALKKKINDLRN